MCVHVGVCQRIQVRSCDQDFSCTSRRGMGPPRLQRSTRASHSGGADEACVLDGRGDGSGLQERLRERSVKDVLRPLWMCVPPGLGSPLLGAAPSPCRSAPQHRVSQSRAEAQMPAGHQPQLGRCAEVGSRRGPSRARNGHRKARSDSGRGSPPRPALTRRH